MASTPLSPEKQAEIENLARADQRQLEFPPSDN